MALSGITTVGVLFGYAVEATAGTKPTAFTQLTRINSIGGISISNQTIDSSALEDEIDKALSGRGSTGGTFNVTVNVTDDTIAEWETLISAYKTAKVAGKQVWFESYAPNLKKAFFVTAEPPTVIPQPSFDQNGLLTVEMTLTINEYKGLDTAIKPGAAK